MKQRFCPHRVNWTFLVSLTRGGTIFGEELSSPRMHTSLTHTHTSVTHTHTHLSLPETSSLMSCSRMQR